MTLRSKLKKKLGKNSGDREPKEEPFQSRGACSKPPGGDKLLDET